MPMDRHALALLEFAAVRAELAELCLSPAGAAQVAAEPFVSDAAAHTELQGEVAALRALLEAERLPPEADLPEVADAMALLSKEGTVLEPDAAARLGRFLRTAGTLRRALRPRGRNDPAMARIAPLLAPADGVEGLPAAIFRVVDPDGTVRERQLPSLAAIRGRIRRLEREVELAARRYLSAPEYRPMLNGDRATERAGRTVLPVKANHQGRIRGIVHEVSSSGATVFIEPEESVRAGYRVVAEELALPARAAPHHARAHRPDRQPPPRSRRHARRRGLLRCALCPRALRPPAPVRRLAVPLRGDRPAGGASPAAGRGRGADRHPLGRRPPRADHHRAQHRRQDGGAEDRGPTGTDEPVRDGGAGRRRQRAAAVRSGAVRHRRRAVDRAISVHLLRPRAPARPRPRRRQRSLPGAARRAGLPAPTPRKG